MKNLIPVERIENKIYLIRNQKVIFDFDLAEFYEVPTKRLNEQVKRNLDRFPDDFMFQLTEDECAVLLSSAFVVSDKERDKLRSQFATSKKGGRRYLPYAFTEQGIAMLSSVLKSKRAVQMNIFIMRAFVKLREVLATHKDLVQKFKKLEMRIGKHDREIIIIFDAIRKLMAPSEKPKTKIGFIK
ncbi:DNA-binding protein [candidate division WOR-1 bacterium RIFOXYD2_FULL_36_8]|uniref:DNA-binding protein n=1 Tax=candidate division WOR-1 bacterium RIFOXYB2_FULL_36_35 TaxID=1802578 RepID=A0A1F4S2N8_UNCSA|nr:MAG: DNA-binding protein [candidate division WOR-1 bacterium RIFOXYA2_FULL_36_21]OGC14637.1 MAG: DNA-binding protein [candidate division WOR-1 bacterium RIFOXYB2_FULL_36_35]OGC19655.1 MAG: DNA-binding protein [candidate division WOR-1 bacterium RIFOXYA12_FULL_36_13]OGC41383.1 MAG: DNA-binding protein [candidate division WOR-1 bacterium RIFOXYD2_FULL_36_8]